MSSTLTLTLLSADRAVKLAECAGTAKAGLTVGAAHDSDFTTAAMRELAPRQALLLPFDGGARWVLFDLIDEGGKGTLLTAAGAAEGKTLRGDGLEEVFDGDTIRFGSAGPFVIQLRDADGRARTRAPGASLSTSSTSKDAATTKGAAAGGAQPSAALVYARAFFAVAAACVARSAPRARWLTRTRDGSAVSDPQPIPPLNPAVAVRSRGLPRVSRG